MTTLIFIIITTTKFNVGTTVIKHDFSTYARCELASTEIASMLVVGEDTTWKSKCLGK
ncbi:MAG: hypothetical protein HOK52_14745 [Candidatus Marinimicrobia bacterium]|jgi:hypothetical protein|nr:hypothetical protein [Candidatus Neomarinimicrobiota bacterium]